MSRAPETTSFDFNAELVRSLPRALRIIRARIGNSAEAEEALQSACVRALERSDQYEPNNMPAWLATIALNLFRTEMRTSKRRRDHIENVAVYAPEDLGYASPATPLQIVEDAETALEASERVAVIQKHLHDLPEHHREAVTAKLEFEGLGHKGVKRGGGPQNTKVAAKLGIEEGTLKSRAHRGMKSLRVKVYAELTEHMIDDFQDDSATSAEA